MKVLRMYRSLNNKDIYIVAEFIENDLHAVIRANICEDLQRKYIIWQLLKALKVNSSSL
jgi:mitogen-activated protein kinase 15